MKNNRSRTVVIVVPRERFSESVNSLQSIKKYTSEEIPIIYVGTSFPTPVAKQIKESLRPGVDKWVEHPTYMSPNESRNVGLENAPQDYEYAVFVDNDVFVHENWLSNLVACADETNASVVAPIYTETKYGKSVIHAAGAGIVEVEGHLEVHMIGHKDEIKHVAPKLERKQIDSPEFHAVLIRRSFLNKIGGKLDPKMRTTREHLDLALEVEKHGETVYLEPTTVVDYKIPTELNLSDFFFYRKRWSYQQVEPTMEYFSKKWGIPMDLQRKNVMKWRQRMAWKGLKNHYMSRLGLQRLDNG